MDPGIEVRMSVPVRLGTLKYGIKRFGGGFNLSYSVAYFEVSLSLFLDILHVQMRSFFLNVPPRLRHSL